MTFQAQIIHNHAYNSGMIPELQTSRLVLRPLELGDAAQVQILFPNWEVVQYLASRVPWPYPSNGAETFYREIALPAIDRGEQWHWTLRLKAAPDRIIGSISLRSSDTENRGFWLGIPWQGLGLMTEACCVVTQYWFDKLPFPHAARIESSGQHSVTAH